MTIFYDAPVTPDALTAFVRNVPIPGTLSLSNAVPDHSGAVEHHRLVRDHQHQPDRSVPLVRRPDPRVRP
jgi:hypothetical protein